MSGMARVLARQGVAVTGSDLRESPTLEVAAARVRHPGRGRA